MDTKAASLRRGALGAGLCHGSPLRPAREQVERQAAAACVAAAEASGAAGEWRAAAGALQLARLLGAGAPAAAEALASVRAAAAGAKGAAAAALVGQIDALVA
jgi:hypothetical protein